MELLTKLASTLQERGRFVWRKQRKGLLWPSIQWLCSGNWMNSAVLDGQELIYFKHYSKWWKTELFVRSKWRAFPNIKSNKHPGDKKGIFFFIFKRNNQLTDTERSVPGRNSKYKRKTEDLISLFLSIATQIFWVVIVILTSFDVKHLLISNGTEM